MPRGGKTMDSIYLRKDRASHAYRQLAISPVYYLASRLMIVVFGLGTRLRVRIRTKLENGVLSNGQQPQSVVKGVC